MKDLLKKYWFLGLVALGLFVYLIVYAIQAYQARPVYVETKESDGKSVVYTLNGVDYYADELYDDLEEYANAAAFAKWKSLVIDEAIEDSEELNTYATNYASYIQQNNEESTIISALKQAGYSNGMDDLFDYCLDLVKSNELNSQYYRTNYDKFVQNVVDSKTPKNIYQILITVEDVEETTDENGNTIYVPNMNEEEQASYDKIVSDLLTKDFETVAKEYYSEQGSESDGFVGLYTSETSSSRFVTPFANSVNSLSFDEVSEPVASEYGYHIIKVTEPTKDELMEDDQFMSEVANFYSYANVYALKEKADELGYSLSSESLKEILDNYIKYADEEMDSYNQNDEVTESEVTE